MSNTGSKKSHPDIVALAGGVGGAKLARGLYLLLQQRGQANASQLTIIGNTADDMEYLDLYICPDLDTLMYNLAGIHNPAQGWGIEGDTANGLEMLARYGNDNWFWLGDRDFATHIWRTHLLKKGESLTSITSRLTTGLGVQCQLLPMCNEPVRTIVHTQEAGSLEFQHYFVRRRAADTVTGLTYAGVGQAQPPAQVVKALENPDLIIICPSNPYLSVEPILQVPGMRQLILQSGARIAVVTPIVGGKALKGPAGRLLETIGGEKSPSALSIARYYQHFASIFVLDETDALLGSQIESLGYRVLTTNTIMKDDATKLNLAQAILEFCQL